MLEIETDHAQIIRDFENDANPDAPFHHADHVRVAVAILARHPEFLVAARAYSDGLKSIAARAGNPAAYHETITLAFLSLIAERMATGTCRDYDAFAAANDDLFDKSTLKRWYGVQRLQSAIARTTMMNAANRASFVSPFA